MNPPHRSRLQQQPQRVVDRQQQQSSGSREFQPRKAPAFPVTDRSAGQMGEDSREVRSDLRHNNF